MPVVVKLVLRRHSIYESVDYFYESTLNCICSLYEYTQLYIRRFVTYTQLQVRYESSVKMSSSLQTKVISSTNDCLSKLEDNMMRKTQL